MKNVIRKKQKIPSLITLLLFYCFGAMAQISINASGIVDEPVMEATVIVKGENSIGITNITDGKNSLTVPGENSALVAPYIDMLPRKTK